MKIPPVRTYLLEDPILDTYEKIFDERGLPKDRKQELLDLTNAIIDGALPPGEAAGLIQEAFKLDEAGAKKLACDVLGYDLLPLQDFVPGIPEAIVALGGRVEEYPDIRVGKERSTPLQWAERLTEKVGLTFSDVLMKRLALLLDGRVQGTKNAEALRTFFSRPLTIGGLALVKEKSDALLALIEEQAPHVSLVSESEWNRLEAEKAKSAEPVDDELPEEEAELVTTTDLVAEVPLMPGNLEHAVNHVMTRTQDVVSGKGIAPEKFQSLVEKHIRGVREPNKTRDILEKEHALEGDDLRTTLDALASGKKAYEGVVSRQSSVASAEEGIDADDEANGLDQKFSQLTKSLPEESIEPMLPGSRVSAARETVMPAKSAVSVKPRLARAELTMGSVPPKAPERKVTDVVAASRLMGPVDQLQNMSIIEFRRLSSDPTLAAQKVADLLSALTQTSYEEKVRGIAAWRKSPMNQLYLEISEEALGTGTPLPDVCSRRRKEGRECLSPSEIKAVVGLNAKLRF